MSAVYPKALEQLLQAGINMSSGSIRLLAVDADYTYASTHDFLDDVAGGARLGTAVALTGKSFTNGVFSAAALSYTGVSSPNVVTGFIGYLHTGTEGTSNLIWFCDTRSDQVAISYAGDGAAIAVSWPLGYIFSL